MATQKWWQSGVIYQVYPRSFGDTNGDGVGDLAGITAHLDYLVDLGIGAVWVSPVYRSPMADFGYDVSDYCAIDAIFGTLADFDALVTAVHARGLKLILDFVPNHTVERTPVVRREPVVRFESEARLVYLARSRTRRRTAQ